MKIEHSRRSGQTARSQALLYLLAGAVVLGGVAAMVALSPRTLYADPWRFAQRLLEGSWPDNVLWADNSHREILPNLVRLAEFAWLDGNQWLQIGIGVALALLTVAMIWRILHDEALPAGVRAAAVFIAALAIFWLGNGRALTHANDSVHAYLVTAFLVAGIGLLNAPGPGRTLLAAICGVGATFSFGSGIAVFVAFAVCLALTPGPWWRWIVMAAGLAAALALHLALGDAGLERLPALDPLASADLTLRWLAAPFIYVAWPALDPQIAAQLPLAPLRTVAGALASGHESLFGPVAVSRWPHLAIGLAGALVLAAASLSCLRRRSTVGAGERLGLGLAWFGLTVGTLAALSRHAYFLDAPEQLVAPRYLPWSSMFWSGLALWGVLAFGRRHPRRAVGATLLLALVVLPSSAWMGALASKIRPLADRVAAGVAVGVLDLDQELGENVASEIVASLPALRGSGKAMFAWPETRILRGQVETPPLQPANAQILSITPVRNDALPGQASRLGLSSDSSAPRLLILCSGRPVGLAVPERLWGDRWVGWVAGEVGQDCLSAVRLRP